MNITELADDSKLAELYLEFIHLYNYIVSIPSIPTKEFPGKFEEGCLGVFLLVLLSYIEFLSICMWDLLPHMEPHVFKIYTDEYAPSKIRELCIIPFWNGFPEEQKLVFTLHYDYNVMKGLQSRKEARIK